MKNLYSRYAFWFCLATALSGCSQYPPARDQAIWENSDNAVQHCANGGIMPGCAYHVDDSNGLTTNDYSKL